ncbi:hypothetical protein MAC_02324 [Metarhizium acridum CQMa 102]|uniref:Uncharacterized protein n=1 Tax=Metarhizium acridum (strain CQMa 102) TaxID=655827 RepID=E9DXH6_METAQ|nr:uncharacterized protein MAC_02324 [Metarhizium acridum CQMa 102]EFY91734.1 hypothetical protein MAC_02324 [Metarhizium acridum CQMa 102]
MKTTLVALLAAAVASVFGSPVPEPDPEANPVDYGDYPPPEGGYGDYPPPAGGYGSYPPPEGGYGSYPAPEGGYGEYPAPEGGYKGGTGGPDPARTEEQGLYIPRRAGFYKLSRCALTLDFAAGKKNNVVGENVDLVQEVRREYDAALGPLLEENLPDCSPRKGIQPGRTLVDQAHGRVADKHAGQLQLALLATTKLPGLELALGGEIALPDQLLQLLARPATRLDAAPDADVLLDRQVIPQGVALWTDTDLRWRGFQRDGPSGWVNEARHHMESRRLARTVGPDQAHNLALLRLETDAVYGRDRLFPTAKATAAAYPRQQAWFESFSQLTSLHNGARRVG